MNRREAIRRTSILLGGTLSMSAITGVMSGCKAEPTINWAPQFFTLPEGAILENMVERIIPRTDTPGAVDAGVHTFIDLMMKEYYPGKIKAVIRQGLKKADEDAKSTYGDSFVSLKPEEQEALLTRYDQEAFEGEGNPDHFFHTLKELTILGFCTSEAGAQEVLKYDPVPGDYKGCIPFEEVGRTWAT